MKKYIAVFFLTPALALAASNEPQFTIKPEQCVALEQGQECYIDVSASWQTNSIGNYCLFANEQQLHCWQNVAHGKWKSEIMMTDNLAVSLKNGSEEIIFTKTIEYAWIYKKRKSKAVRWRMF
ncbi:DUF3019 domain-containing protein [Pseudoalteromonas luteoviolacea]|uniref:DUF3019 domain-containing protein n=1 Tax=Pseudoalteromonas luteoviolacea TaxID=43657 RepID=UPI001B39F9BE|nr:DUF3019 domain-containing protein [Pseudoalteromonas luteoviolacea]MBQ4877873.1 DUF3019 domain-containing protein [Pseudoalteromonas luteoviolacea]MBQ4906908.1 DUF3019 domain-containing protein [Pseudoalteromonas luteoviolacea]